MQKCIVSGFVCSYIDLVLVFKLPNEPLTFVDLRYEWISIYSSDAFETICSRSDVLHLIELKQNGNRNS